MIKKFIYQFYFILYQHYYNRYQYLTYSIKFSPEGNASNVVAMCFLGWLFLFYFILFKILGFPVFNKYGKSIVVFAGLIGVALIRNYFTTNTRYLEIYNEFKNQDLKKSRIIFSVVIFFILPFLILTFLFLTGWL
jgi:hypothetical protein